MQTTSIPNATATAAPKASPKDAKLWDVSRQFEAMFMNQMLKSMRKTVATDEDSETSQGREIFTEMLDTEYASMASKESTQGLAGAIFRFLKQEEDRDDIPLPITKIDHTIVSQKPAESQPRSAVKELPSNVKRWNELLDEASKDFELPNGLLHQVMLSESGGNPKAQSPAGAKGLMQLMDTTATDVGVRDVWDPRQNIRGAARYMRRLLDRYQGNISLALAAYNAGPSRIDSYGGIPPFKETQRYVKNIMNGLNKMNAFSNGGSSDLFE